jgi:hypothetical protein
VCGFTIGISKYKPSWQQCGVGLRDPLASIVKVLNKEIQQFPLGTTRSFRSLVSRTTSPRSADASAAFRPSGPSGHGGKVIKQSSLLWFLKQNSRKFIGTLRGTSVNYLRYLTTNSTMAPKNTKVVELLTLMVKKKCPMVAITDNSGALLTTFSFSCLRVMPSVLPLLPNLATHTTRALYSLVITNGRACAGLEP